MSSPHPASFPSEPLARAAHRSLAVTWGTDTSYAVSPVRLVRVGFANIPVLVIDVRCKARDLPGVIPVCRQAAFSYLAERDIADKHLQFRPSVQQSARRGKFTDQHGHSKMGETHEVRFELSGALAAAVQWEWNGRGTLKAGWEL